MAGRESDAAIEQRAQQRVVEIGGMLSEHLIEITEVLQAELVERIEDLKGDPIIVELLQASTQGNLEAVAHLVQGQIPLESLEVPATANEYARRLAQRGIGLDALLRAYRLGQRRFLEWAFEQLSTIEPDPAIRFAAARQVTTTTFEYVDRIAEGIVESYQVEREQWLASRNTVRTEILESLLAGHHIDVATAESGLGHRLRQHHMGLVLWHSRAGTATQDLRDLEQAANTVARTVESSASPLFISRDHATAWAWLSLGRSSPDVDAAAIRAAVEAEQPGIRVAMGTPGAAEEGFRATHAEALKAQHVAMIGQDHALPVTWYGDSGVRAASLLTADLDATRRLVTTSLGGLAVDSENAARLRETLLTFLQCNDSYVATAERVHLHKNTVKYRVDKAVAARGIPLDVDRLDLELALIACQWLAPAVLRPAD